MNLAYNKGNPVSIPRSGRFPGRGNDNPFQYSCLENPMRSMVGFNPCGHKESDRLSD